jgi:alkylhydroperoxidase family enzyme
MRQIGDDCRGCGGQLPAELNSQQRNPTQSYFREAGILKLRPWRGCGIVRAKSVAGGTMSPRISYVQPSSVTDKEMLAEFDRCAREGTPRPESQAIRAHVPATFWSFANTWQTVFRNGVADHSIKELCRVYVSRSVLCEFCGNQRSIKAAKAGTIEDDYMDLINFESSTRYSEKQKAALAYAEMITWDLPATDAVWGRLHKHFSEPELVEIGYFIAITMGQQRWLRTLNIEHHQVLAGQDGSMAPGFETMDALKASKAQADYWAKKRAAPQSEAAE